MFFASFRFKISKDRLLLLSGGVSRLNANFARINIAKEKLRISDAFFDQFNQSSDSG